MNVAFTNLKELLESLRLVHEAEIEANDTRESVISYIESINGELEDAIQLAENSKTGDLIEDLLLIEAEKLQLEIFSYAEERINRLQQEEQEDVPDQSSSNKLVAFISEKAKAFKNQANQLGKLEAEEVVGLIASLQMVSLSVYALTQLEKEGQRRAIPFVAAVAYTEWCKTKSVRIRLKEFADKAKSKSKS